MERELRNSTRNEGIEAIASRLSSYASIKQLDWVYHLNSRSAVDDHHLIRMLRVYNDFAKQDLAELESDLAVLKGTKNFLKVCTDLKNRFFEERASLRSAAYYKRKGFDIEFISTSPRSKTPDFTIRQMLKSRPPFYANFEVKHIGDPSTLHRIVNRLREIDSPYQVRIHPENFALERQTKHFEQMIVDDLSRLMLSSEKPTVERPYVHESNGSKFEIVTNETGEPRKTEVAEMSWSYNTDLGHGAEDSQQPLREPASNC